MLAASGHACGGRGSALLPQQGTWAGGLLEGLCNRGFVLVGTFFVSLMVGLWDGRLSFERFGHKSREVGWDCAKILIGTNKRKEFGDFINMQVQVGAISSKFSRMGF